MRKTIMLTTLLALIAIVVTSFSATAQFTTAPGVLKELSPGLLCNAFEGYPGDRIDCRATYAVVTPGKSLVEVCVKPDTGFLVSIFATPTNLVGNCRLGQTFCYSYIVDSSNAKVGDVTNELHFYPTVPTPDSKAWSTTGDGYGKLYHVVKDSVTQCCATPDGKPQSCDAVNPYGWGTNQIAFTVLKKDSSTITPTPTAPAPAPTEPTPIDVTPTTPIPVAPPVTPTAGFFDIVDEVKFLQQPAISYFDVSPTKLTAGTNRKLKALVYVKNTGSTTDTMKVEGGIYKTKTLIDEFGVQSLTVFIPKQAVGNCDVSEKNVATYDVTLKPGEIAELQFVVDTPIAVSVPDSSYSFFVQTYRTCYKDLPAGSTDVGSTDYRRIPLTFTEFKGWAGEESCSDNFQNQDETGIDCGGVCGATCQKSAICASNDDCAPPLICKLSDTKLRCETRIGDENGTIKLCGGKPCDKRTGLPTAISLTSEQYDKATDTAIIAAMCEFPTDCAPVGDLSINCLGGEDVRIRNEEAVKRVELRVVAGGTIGDVCEGASSALQVVPIVGGFSGIAKTACIHQFAAASANEKLLSGTCRAGEEGGGLSGIVDFFKTVGELFGLKGSTATGIGATIVIGLGLLILNMAFGKRS